MPAVTITVPADFAVSMKKLMDNMQKLVDFTQQVNLAITPQKIQIHQVNASKVKTQLNRLLQIFRKIGESFVRALDAIMNTMGTVGKAFLRSLSAVTSVLGPIISFSVGAATLAVQFSVTALASIAGFSRWLWDKMVGLGDSILQDYLMASGLGTSIGGVRAFRAAFRGLPEDPAFASNVTQARGQVTSRQLSALMNLGVTQFKDNADMMVKATLSAAHFMKRQPKGTEMLMAESYGLLSLFTPERLFALGNMPEEELEYRAKLYEANKLRLDISLDARKGWIDFSLQVKKLGVQIQSVIGKVLADPNSDLVKALTHLSKSLTDFLRMLMDAPVIRTAIKKLGVYINEFADWLKDEKTMGTMNKFIQNVAEFTKAMIEGIRQLKRLMELFGGPAKLVPSHTHYGRRGLAERIGMERPRGAPYAVPGRPIARYPGREKFTHRIGVTRPSGAPPISPEAPIKRYPGRERFAEKIGIARPPTAPRISPRPVRPGAPSPPGPTAGFGQDVHGAITQASKETGVDATMMRKFASIESGGRAGAVTGSYKGLYQLSDSEFQKYGGGDIFNPVDNARAAAKKLSAESKQFEDKFGRKPEGHELYMIHQQGWGGFQAHMANPDKPAWEAMAGTGEGRQKGEGWAKKAIWGNLPDSAKRQFGSVDNVTSGQFMDWWKGRYDRAAGGRPAGEIAPGAQAGQTDQPSGTAFAGNSRLTTEGNYRLGSDPRRAELLKAAGEASKNLPPGWRVEAYSGERTGPGQGPHATGGAIDFRLIDPQGHSIENYQTPQNYAVYEKFAQDSHIALQKSNPALASQHRWGGYFSGPIGPGGKYGAMDLMHQDFAGGNDRMAAGKWETGIDPGWKQRWGVGESSPGIAAQQQALRAAPPPSGYPTKGAAPYQSYGQDAHPIDKLKVDNRSDQDVVSPKTGSEYDDQGHQDAHHEEGKDLPHSLPPVEVEKSESAEAE